MKVPSREEQREQFAPRQMVAIGLECQLRILLGKIRAGETVQLQVFARLIQLAPQEMLEHLQTLLGGLQ